MRHLGLLALLALAAALTACGSQSPAAPSDPCPDCVRFTEGAADSLLDPAVIDEAVVDGDTLRLRVTYAGGCRDHEFALYAPPEFEDSPGVALSLYLRHDDRDDPCDAIVHRDLAFDLTPARQFYLATFGQPGSMVLRITTTLEGERVSVVWDLR